LVSVNTLVSSLLSLGSEKDWITGKFITFK